MRYAIVGAGGGTRGATQVGPIQRLRAKHGPCVLSCGTSIAAVNMSVHPDLLRDIWLGVKGPQSFMRPSATPTLGLKRFGALRRLLVGHGAARADGEAWVGVVDSQTLTHRMVALHELEWSDRIDAIIASASQPAIHHRAKLRGRYTMDGGVRSVTGRLPGIPTIDGAHHAAGLVDEIHLLVCSPFFQVQRARDERHERDVNSAIEAAMVAIEVMQDAVMQCDAAYWIALSAHVPVYLYAPQSWEQVGAVFDADPTHIRRLLDLGDRMQPIRLRSDFSAVCGAPA